MFDGGSWPMLWRWRRAVSTSGLVRNHVHGFYWLIEGKLAGCPRPGGIGMPDRYTHEVTALDDDLVWLRRQGVGAVLSLTEEPLESAAFARHELEWLHLPVIDLTAPAPLQIEAALEFIDWHVAYGRAVAVHCKMGQGRTGTVLAAYLIRAGTDVGAAVAEVRGVCPGAIGSAAQEQALAEYARRRDWLI
jgi:atypical dual specificity phosphatase